MAAVRSGPLDIRLGESWMRVSATLDPTALILQATDHQLPSSSSGSEQRVVRLVKHDGHGLGISIKGGRDNGLPVMISKIFPGMAAAETGELFVGDAILAVNGESLRHATHDQAVKLLKRTGRVVDLTVVFTGDNFDQLAPSASSSYITSQLDALDWDEKIGGPQLRTLPLKLAFVTRSTQIATEDPEGKTFEIRSSSGRYSLAMRAPTRSLSDAWFEALLGCTSALNTQLLAQLNLMLGGCPAVRRIGWLAEWDATANDWHSTFCCLTSADLLFYDAVPLLKSEWAEPLIRRPLIATRVVHTTSRAAPLIVGLSDVISFVVRAGTREGVRAHLLRTETHRELSHWVRAIVAASLDATLSTKHITAPCTYLEERCELWLDLDGGLSLCSPSDGHVVWAQPWRNLRASGDDGQSKLWLDLGTQLPHVELDMGENESAKPIVFIMHAFLVANISRLNLYA